MAEAEGAVDIATLGIAVDASQVNAGADGLDKLTESGERAEAATKKVGNASAELARVQADLATSNNLLADTQGKLKDQTAATDELQTKLANTSNQLAEANAKLASASSQAAQAVDNAGKSTDKAGDASGQLAKAQGDLAAKSLQLVDTQNKLDFQHKATEAAEKRLAATTAELAAANDRLANGSNEAAKGVEKIGESAEKANKSTEELGDAAGEAVSKVDDNFGKAGDKASDFVARLEDSAGQVNKITDLIGVGLSQGVEGGLSALVGAIGRYAGELIGGFGQVGETLGEQIVDMGFDKAREALGSFKEQFNSSIGEMIEQAKSGGEASGDLASKAGDTASAIGDAADKAQQGAEGLEKLKGALGGAAEGAEAAAAEGGAAAGAFEGISAGAIAGAAGAAILVAALGAVLIAAESNRQTLEHWQEVAAGTGRFAGQTAQQFEDMAARVADASNVTVGAARESVEAFARAGAENGRDIEALAGIVENYSRLAGVDAAEANSQLAQSFSDPIGAAEELNGSLGFLSQAQMEQIRTLKEQGDGAAASSVLIKALTGDVNENAVAVGGAKGAYRSLISSLSSAWQWFTNLSGAIDSATSSYNKWMQAQGLGALQVGFGYTENKETPAQAAFRQAQALARKNSTEAYSLVSGSNDNTNRDVTNSYVAQAKQIRQALADNDRFHTLSADAVERLRTRYTALIDTRNAYISNGKIMTDADIAHNIATQQTISNNKNLSAATRAAAQAEVARLQSLGQVMTADERATVTADRLSTATAGYTAKVRERKDTEGDRIAKHLAQLQAEVDGQRRVNAAIDDGTGSEIRATAAKAAATEMAGKKYSAQQAELEQTLQYSLALEKFIGKTMDAVRASDDQLQSVKAINEAIAKGANANDAANEAKIAAQTLPIEEVLTELKAKGQEGTEAYRLLNEQLQQLRANLQGINAETAKTQFDSASKKSQDNTSLIRGQIEDVGKSPLQKALDESQRQADQDNANAPASQTSEQDAQHIKDLQDAARATVELKTAQDAYNESLHATSDRLKDIQAEHAATGQLLSSAFGDVGNGIATAISAIDNYRVTQQQAAEEQEAALEKYAGMEEQYQEEIARIKQHYASVSATAQINAIGSTLGALKGMFSEHSKGYRVIEAVERAIAIVRLVNSAKEIASMFTKQALTISTAATSVAADATTTASSVAASTAKGAASTAAGAAKMFETLGPFGFAAVAAMLAVLVSLGGGKGGGASASAPSSGPGSSEPLSPVDRGNENSLYSVGNGDNISSNNGGYNYAPNATITPDYNSPYTASGSANAIVNNAIPSTGNSGDTVISDNSVVNNYYYNNDNSSEANYNSNDDSQHYTNSVDNSSSNVATDYDNSRVDNVDNTDARSVVTNTADEVRNAYHNDNSVERNSVANDNRDDNSSRATYNADNSVVRTSENNVDNRKSYETTQNDLSKDAKSFVENNLTDRSSASSEADNRVDNSTRSVSTSDNSVNYERKETNNVDNTKSFVDTYLNTNNSKSSEDDNRVDNSTRATSSADNRITYENNNDRSATNTASFVSNYLSDGGSSNSDNSQRHDISNDNAVSNDNDYDNSRTSNSEDASDNRYYNITKPENNTVDNTSIVSDASTNQQAGDTYQFTYYIDARGSDDPDAVDDRLQQTMRGFQDDTVNKARVAVRKDTARDATRQVIGRSA